MSFTYLHVVKEDPFDWIEAFYEIDPSNKITRMVTVEIDGTSVANSVAILSHRSGAFADAVYGGGPKCIFFGGFPKPQDYDEYWSRKGCTFEAMKPVEVQRRFMAAKVEF